MTGGTSVTRTSAALDSETARSKASTTNAVTSSSITSPALRPVYDTENSHERDVPPATGSPITALQLLAAISDPGVPAVDPMRAASRSNGAPPSTASVSSVIVNGSAPSLWTATVYTTGLPAAVAGSGNAIGAAVFSTRMSGGATGALMIVQS